MSPKHSGSFKAGDPRTRELGKKGGEVTAKKRRAAAGLLEPYQGTILDVMDIAGLTGASWRPWRAFWKAVYALPMDPAELGIYQRHTEREGPPAEPVSEAWMPIGRRGGKSQNAAIAGLHRAVSFDPDTLSPGELAVIPILAADRKQARSVLGYLRALCELDEFEPYVHRPLKESIEFVNNVNVEVHTASYKTVRGYTCPAVIADEIAFWTTDDGAANPDTEVLQALRPGMATVPGSLLLGLSSPYAARGELYQAVEQSFGKDDGFSLVWNADTRSMNPTLPAHVVERAFERDPVAAASEYGTGGRVQWRRDVEAFLDREAIDAATASDVREIPPQPGVNYVAFVDPSGGSQDSMTLAIGHSEGEGSDRRAVLDAVREVKPPFSPDDTVIDFCQLLNDYRVSRVTGDRYAGEWPRERFKLRGITYQPAERTKSDIYREFVAPVNAGRVQLLDLPVLRNQLLGLERRVARGGRDSIDHAPGGRDDVANAAAGALVNVLGVQRGKIARLIA